MGAPNPLPPGIVRLVTHKDVDDDGVERACKALAAAPIPFAANDPLPYLFLCLLMMLSALVAMVGHARRAARVEPVVALREE